MATSLDLARTYTSYSGVDIRVVINGAQVGSMQALSYAIQREKAPIYVMGSVDPVSYSRGKRGIAGTMISLMMDTHILMSPSFTGEFYLGDTDEVFPSVGGPNVPPSKYKNPTSILNNVDNEVNNAVSLSTLGGRQFGASAQSFTGIGDPRSGTGAFSRIQRETTYNEGDLSNNYRVAPVFYVDQILPFDIAIVAANEYGQSAQMRLYGCEILNEGSGFSIDDIVIENQMTYVCRTILPWRSFNLHAKTPKGDIINAKNALYTKLGTKKNRGYSDENPETIRYQGADGTLPVGGGGGIGV